MSNQEQYIWSNLQSSGAGAKQKKPDSGEAGTSGKVGSDRKSKPFFARHCVWVRSRKILC